MAASVGRLHRTRSGYTKTLDQECAAASSGHRMDFDTKIVVPTDYVVLRRPVSDGEGSPINDQLCMDASVGRLQSCCPSGGLLDGLGSHLDNST